MKRVEPEVAALRKRFAQRRDEQSRAHPQELTAEELHRLSDKRLTAHAAELQRLAAHHRAEQAHARAAGDKEISTTLGMLATIFEKDAKRCESERRERDATLKLRQRSAQPKTAAKSPRPRRRPALRDSIAATLAPLKREGVEFRVLMRKWRAERIGTLRLDDLGEGRFRVTDEDGAANAVADYARGTLEKLFSQSRTAD